MDENKVINEKIVFRQLVRKDVADLVNSDFRFSKLPMIKRILQVHPVRLIPREMMLVAFHVEDKRAIGHLMLTNHTNSLYSIQCVFTNPRYRKMGVASGLLNYALTVARKRGGQKVFLTADPNDDTGKLYAKLGFKTIVNTATILTAGSPKSPFENQFQLVSLDLHSKSSKQTLYGIYEKCMGAKWIEFFETNNQNIVNGFSQNFRRYPFKAAFVNPSANSLVLVSSDPLLSNASAELYTPSDDLVTPMLKGLFRIMRQRGIMHVKLTLLNIKAHEINGKDFSLLREMDYLHHMMFMGKFDFNEHAS